MVEMTDSRCAQCAIVDQLREHFEAEYKRKAAEMRRMMNQAHEQLAVSVREIQELQDRNKELEETNENTEEPPSILRGTC